MLSILVHVQNTPTVDIRFYTNRVRGPSITDGPIFFRLDLWPIHLLLGPEKTSFHNLQYIRVSRKLFIFSKFK